MPELDDTDLDTETTETELIRELRATLKRQAAQIKDLAGKAEKLESYERADMVSKAGLLNLNETQLKALAALHEGENTPDGWRKTAVELGFVSDERQAQASEAAAAETRQAEVIAGAHGAGAEPDLNTQIRQAQTAGDWQLADQLRAAKFQELADARGA